MAFTSKKSDFLLLFSIQWQLTLHLILSPSLKNLAGFFKVMSLRWTFGTKPLVENDGIQFPSDDIHLYIFRYIITTYQIKVKQGQS